MTSRFILMVLAFVTLVLSEKKNKKNVFTVYTFIVFIKDVHQRNIFLTFSRVTVVNLGAAAGLCSNIWIAKWHRLEKSKKNLSLLRCMIAGKNDNWISKVLSR